MTKVTSPIVAGQSFPVVGLVRGFIVVPFCRYGTSGRRKSLIKIRAATVKKRSMPFASGHPDQFVTY
jgi:hypothetical protein